MLVIKLNEYQPLPNVHGRYHEVREGQRLILHWSLIRILETRDSQMVIKITKND